MSMLLFTVVPTPQRSREIWQYVSVINTAAASYSWENVANYDYTFRHLMEFNPSRSWATTYNQMWNLSMRDPLPRGSSSKQQQYNQHYQGKSSYRQNNPTNSHNSQHNQSSSKKKGKQTYCLYFNRGEKCKYGDKCRFTERCSYCDGADHHVLVCPKLTKKD